MENFNSGSLIDPSFILGVVIGALLLPALKSTTSITVSYFIRIGLGFFYYRKANYPDIISITLNIFYRDESGRLCFGVDTLVGDHLLHEVFRNPFVAYKVRAACALTTPATPLMRFDIAARSKRFPILRWILGRGKADLKHRRRLRAKRYTQVYNPLISLAGQYLTTEGAALHAVGVPCRIFRFVVSATYERGIPERDQHHRCMLTLEEAMLNLPAECPQVFHPQHIHRFETVQKLAKLYGKAPWKFGILELRVPLSQLKERVPYATA
jgi:hypothetical protein